MFWPVSASRVSASALSLRAARYTPGLACFIAVRRVHTAFASVHRTVRPTASSSQAQSLFQWEEEQGLELDELDGTHKGGFTVAQLVVRNLRLAVEDLPHKSGNFVNVGLAVPIPRVCHAERVDCPWPRKLLPRQRKHRAPRVVEPPRNVQELGDYTIHTPCAYQFKSAWQVAAYQQPLLTRARPILDQLRHKAIENIQDAAEQPCLRSHLARLQTSSSVPASVLKDAQR